MPENSVSVGLKIDNPEVRRKIESIIAGLHGFIAQENPRPTPCDVLIMEIDEGSGEKFDEIRALLESEDVREVFLTSARATPEILIQAMRSGAKEFFPQPIDAEDVSRALLQFQKKAESLDTPRRIVPKKGKIINVIGGKGGVGATTVAVNLATNLNALNGGGKVALLDMNLLFGEIPLFLDMKPTFNWGEIAKNITRLDSTYLMGILSEHPSGLLVLPSPSKLELEQAATPEVLEKLLGIMRSVFDFIVIDNGHNVNAISLKITELSNFVLIIASMSLACLINVKKLKDTFRKFGLATDDSIKVIANRFERKLQISIEEAEEVINGTIFWKIPNDYRTTMIAINQGKPLSEVAHKAKITRNFQELAAVFKAGGEI